jgi:hypothetical protein
LLSSWSRSPLPWARRQISEYTAAVAALASADPAIDPPANNPKTDFVVGGFEDVFGEKVGLSARSSPAGEDPFGHESVTLPHEYKIRSRIVCLAVDGNLAAWGTRSTQTDEAFVEVVKDGGPGGTKDRWNFLEEPPEDCADFLESARQAPLIVSGDILVNDAQG